MTRAQALDAAVRRVIRRFYPTIWREMLLVWLAQGGPAFATRRQIIIEFDQVMRGA